MTIFTMSWPAARNVRRWPTIVLGLLHNSLLLLRKLVRTLLCYYKHLETDTGERWLTQDIIRTSQQIQNKLIKSWKLIIFYSSFILWLIVFSNFDDTLYDLWVIHWQLYILKYFLSQTIHLDQTKLLIKIIELRKRIAKTDCTISLHLKWKPFWQNLVLSKVFKN